MIRFLRTYFFQSTTDHSRFVEGDHPTQLTFESLFDSVAFIRQKEDTAKLNEQGLAKCTTDVAAQDRDSSPGPDQMTRFIQPHQLPNVFSDAGSGIGVEPLFLSTGRTGGSGLDFKIRNLLRFQTVSPLVVTSVVNLLGELIYTFSINQAALNNLETGKVKVFSDDTTADYLFAKITSLNPNLTGQILNPGGNEILALNWVERIGEVKMFAGDAATVFAGGYNNTVGHVWRGWALCDGNTYNAFLTPDMRGFVPIGYNPDVTANPKYSDIKDHDDDTAAIGVNSVTLTRGQLPKHVHMISDGVDNASQSNPGNHTHSYVNWPNQADIGEGGTTATDNSVATNQVTGGNGAHTHSGNTGDGTSNPGGLGLLNNEAHPNRQPFTVLAFIVYVGY